MKRVILTLLFMSFIGCTSQVAPLPTVASLPKSDDTINNSPVLPASATPLRKNSLAPIITLTDTVNFEATANIVLQVNPSNNDGTENTNSRSSKQDNGYGTTSIMTATPVDAINQNVWFVIMSSTANAYACPDINCNVLTIFDPASPVRVLAIDNGWHQVRLPFGGEAYIESTLLFLPDGGDTVQNQQAPASINQNQQASTSINQQIATSVPQQPPTNAAPNFTATPPGADNPIVTPDSNQPPQGNGPPPGV